MSHQRHSMSMFFYLCLFASAAESQSSHIVHLLFNISDRRSHSFLVINDIISIGSTAAAAWSRFIIHNEWGWCPRTNWDISSRRCHLCRSITNKGQNNCPCSQHLQPLAPNVHLKFGSPSLSRRPCGLTALTDTTLSVKLSSINQKLIRWEATPGEMTLISGMKNCIHVCYHTDGG